MAYLQQSCFFFTLSPSIPALTGASKGTYPFPGREHNQRKPEEPKRIAEKLNINGWFLKKPKRSLYARNWTEMLLKSTMEVRTLPAFQNSVQKTIIASNSVCNAVQTGY